MAFKVYILENDAGRFYVGHTDDLDRRLAEHNNPDHNRRKYTSKHLGPWRLVYVETYATRREAMRRERWLKSGVGRQWLDQRLVRASPPKAD